MLRVAVVLSVWCISCVFLWPRLKICDLTLQLVRVTAAEENAPALMTLVFVSVQCRRTVLTVLGRARPSRLPPFRRGWLSRTR